MKKATLLTVGILIGASIGGYFLYGKLMHHAPGKSASSSSEEEMDMSEDRMVTYVKPKTYVGTKAAITSYLGEIQTEKNGQIYPYRNGIVEAYLANVGDTVKKGQIVARLLPAEYSADIANMIADRRAERTRSEGMVKSANLTLSQAKIRKANILEAADIKLGNANSIKNRVSQTTATQLAKTATEQDANIAKLESDLANVDVQIASEQTAIDNMRKSTDASVSLESDKLGLRESTVKTAVKNAHSTLFRIFYGNTYANTQYLPNQFKSEIYSVSSLNAANDFSFTMTKLHTRYQNIDSLSHDETFALAKDTVLAIDQGIKVIDSVVASSDYTASMAAADKSDLIATKMDSMNGILTILNMYEEQKSMLAKESAVSASEYANETLMLEKLKAERVVAEKELAMAKAAKDKMLADVSNEKSGSENDASKMVAAESADKIMSLAEADRMVTEAEKMVIDANSSYQAASEALGVLESAGFSNEVRAPFAGRISRRYVNAGESISMSSPLYDIVGFESKKDAPKTFVRFEIPETDLSDVSIGKEVRFYRTADPLRKLTAKIARISPAVGSSTKGIVIEAELSTGTDLPIGSSVRVEMEKSGNMLLVSTSSVIQSDDGKLSVYVIDANFMVHLKEISTERTVGLDVYVSSGIAKDDHIIETPRNYTFLAEGVKVDPMEKPTVATPTGWAPTMGAEHAGMKM